MSGEEYEEFKITSFDLENEFNPNRSRRRPTRNQQIYGMWADSDDSDQSDKKNKKKGRNKFRNDYSAPIGFVAGGIQQAGKSKEDGNDSNKDDSDSNNEITDRSVDGNSSSDSDRNEQRPQIGGMAGFRTAASATGISGGGNWEKHTKGIGAKLLLQMGYQPGKGLGKDLQGISQPILANVRKGRGAIGAYGPEQGHTIGELKQPKKEIDQDLEEARAFKEKMNQWKKDPSVGDKKLKYKYYKSVQDVIEKGKHKNYALSENLSSKLGNVTVIDMTGPEKRVLSGYHALGQAKTVDEVLYEHQPLKKCTNFSLPELMHNLTLIVDMCEQEIISIDRTQRAASDRERALQQDRENLEKILELEQNHISTLEKAMHLIERLTKPSEQLAMAEAAKIFIELQHDYAAEYKEFALADLAPGVIAPLFLTLLDDWVPLNEPTRYIDLLRQWRTILNFHPSTSTNIFDPYSALVWSGIMPSIRTSVLSWNPKFHQPMAALLDAWAPLLPSWILDNILEQLILPKLTSCVESWDPLTDTTPIHSWILPWHGILGHKLNITVYPIIREKLGNALIAWLPQDRSARAMIYPWYKIFDDGDLESFLIKHIIPKLQISLSELIINPLQQDLECWNQVWEWNEMVPTVIMAQLLDKFFFPKWIQTLVIWLNQSPNLDQVSRWYSMWKSLLSDSILQQTNIKESFRRALDLMHRSTGALPESVSPPPAPPPPALMDLQIIPPPQLEFKELVSKKCSERGIIFAPMPGRRELGKQVYRVGKLFCYIDRSLVLISDGSFSNWTPVSVNALLERAISGFV